MHKVMVVIGLCFITGTLFAQVPDTTWQALLNREVVITETSGIQVSGTLTLDSANSISLIISDGQVVTIPKGNIDSVRAYVAGSTKSQEQQTNQKTNKSTDSATMITIQSMISSGAFMNDSGRLQLQTASENLPMQDRQSLYNSNQKNNAGSMMGLNLLITGLGSFVQGDTTGGIELLGFALGGGILIGVGTSSTSDSGGTLLAIGVGAVIGSVIGDFARPWVFQDRWNKNLADALGVAVAMVPTDGEYGSGLAQATPRVNKGVEITLVSYQY